MSFVNIWLLGGAAFAAVPVILHLVMRQQPRHLEFPALRFIQLRQDANRRRLRLRHLLLLALRAGALVLLAAALARPRILSTGVIGGQEAPVAAALVFDTAPRMEYRHENRSRLEAARQVGGWVLKQLPRESDVAILDSLPGKPGFQVDADAARDRLERLDITFAGEPLWKRVLAAAELLEKSDRTRRELYVFTDLAQDAWTVDAPAEFQRRLAQLHNTSLYLVDVGREDYANLALGELRLSAQILPANTPLVIDTELAALGPGGERIIELVLSDSQGREVKRGQEVVRVPDGGAQSVEFVLGGLEPGTHQGLLRLAGSDALTIDNVRYFTVQVRPPWRVLIAAPAPAARHAWYLSEALEPSEWRKTGQSWFSCQVLAHGKLDETDLSSYAAVVLLDPPAFTDDTWIRLADYARSGGGLAIFLGPAAQPREAFNQTAPQELLPGPLAFQARFPDGNCYLTAADDSHPLLARFRPLRGQVPWQNFPVYRYWHLGELHSVNVVMRYTTNQPALVERPVGKGRVLTMTTPASEPPDLTEAERWNQLLLGIDGWPFFMLTNELMLYLVGSADTPLNFSTGETAAVRLSEAWPFDTYLVLNPRGDEVRQVPDAGRQLLLVAATQWPGHYRIRAGGEREGVSLGFSTNLPLSASRLERVSREQIQALFGKLEFRLASSQDEIDRQVSRGRVGRELFPLLALLLAAALAAEHLLANRFYRDR